MAEKAKALLAKLRFIEWLSARGDLSALDLRVAIRLVSLCHARRGYAWPSLDGLATDFSVSRRTIIRAINRLVETSIFEKCRGGGRGYANQYRPRFDLLPDGDAFATPQETVTAPSPINDEETVSQPSPFNGDDDDLETVTNGAERVTRIVINSDPQVTPSEENSIRGISNRSAAAASAGADGLRLSDEELKNRRETARHLRCLEDWLKENQHTSLTNNWRGNLRRWLTYCEAIYHNHENDRQREQARRLGDEIFCLLERP